MTWLHVNGKPKTMKAHRAVYLLRRGEVPAGLHLLHSCDNPPCCNPAHLRPGTHLENMVDRKRRGAGYPRGNDNPRAQVVPESLAEEIRAAYVPRSKGRDQHSLAALYGMSRTQIQRIVTRSDRWKESA